jgi:hypothetical protein
LDTNTTAREAANMASGQLYPPHKIPGIDQFLQDPGPLHNVTITPTGTTPIHINVHATATSRQSGEEIALGIYWQPGDPGPGMAMHGRVGDLEASIEHGDAGPEWLGRPHPRDVGPGLWDLFQSLWAVYLHARHLRDAYLDDFDEYLLARIDAATLRYSHPNRARLARNHILGAPAQPRRQS